MTAPTFSATTLLISLGVFVFSCGQPVDGAPPVPRPITAGSVPALPKPVMADEILDIVTGYIAYTRQLWHEEAPGGYWGGGLAEKDGNGSVRASNSILLGHAILAYAWKCGWLTEDEQATLTEAGLDREGLVGRVRAGLDYICAHHVSAESPLEPMWGNSWQSSLWIGPAAEAAMLVWEDLPEATREAARRLPRPEADRIAATAPRDYRPGNTGAEENAWDMHALAAAIALNPDHPSAPQWWDGLKRYAVNTYSMKADQSDDSIVGEDRVRDLVNTANLFDDFTLENHNFFHPDYIQVSGQHLGEAWMILVLGDFVFQTSNASRFEPYALHKVKPVWENVLRALLLPDGEFLFPNGNDWTLHTSINLAYLAWIAVGVRDPAALAAEKRFVRAAERRRAVSPPGRIFADFNMEWWWEPLLVKRHTSALLMHTFRAAPPASDAAFEVLDQGTRTRHFPQGHVWLHRNGNYAVSASWGRIHVGVFVPFGSDYLQNPYMTIPIWDGVLPDDVSVLVEMGDSGAAPVAVLGRKEGTKCALVCLPNSVVWLSEGGFRPLGIENDRLTGTGRTLQFDDGGTTRIPAVIPWEPFEIPSRWVCLDGRFGLILSGGMISYTPAGKYNQRSVAVDRILPVGEVVAWQMIPEVNAVATKALADALDARSTGDEMVVTVRDGAKGGRYRILASLGKTSALADSAKKPEKKATATATEAPDMVGDLVSVRVEKIAEREGNEQESNPHP